MLISYLALCQESNLRVKALRAPLQFGNKHLGDILLNGKLV